MEKKYKLKSKSTDKEIKFQFTKEQINKAPNEMFTKEGWNPLIKFFWDRYNKRYFNPIEYLRKEPTPFEIRDNCGFLITTIDCVLIETLEQYYCGEDMTKGKNHDPYLSFCKRVPELNCIIKDKKDAGLFLGLIRDGLVHQSKTKKASVINKKPSTLILEWFNKKDKNQGFKINREKFHECVYNEYKKLIEELKKEDNSELRKKFKLKLITIIE